MLVCKNLYNLQKLVNYQKNLVSASFPKSNYFPCFWEVIRIKTFPLNFLNMWLLNDWYNTYTEEKNYSKSGTWVSSHTYRHTHILSSLAVLGWKRIRWNENSTLVLILSFKVVYLQKSYMPGYMPSNKMVKQLKDFQGNLFQSTVKSQLWNHTCNWRLKVSAFSRHALVSRRSRFMDSGIFGYSKRNLLL